MEVIQHPETNELWYAPGSEAINAVNPSYVEGSKPEKIPPGEWKRMRIEAEARNAESGAKAVEEQSSRHRRAPARFYILGRKEMFDPIDEKPTLKGQMMGPRTGTGYQQNIRTAQWRKGTGDLWLETMRRTAAEALITRATRTREDQESRFMLPVSRWEDIVNVEGRESVLWLPEEAPTGDGAAAASSGSEYATYDIDDAKYNMKMAVFNLHQLLGPTEVARLKGGAPEIFDQHQVVVLKRFGSHSMISLHLLLWRLQGYLRKSPELLESKTDRQSARADAHDGPEARDDQV